jgi:hypothetical protein
MVSAREAVELSHIEVRLLAKFVPPLRAEDVGRCLEAAAMRYRTARVRTYLSILIERTASDLLSIEQHCGERAESAEVVDLWTRITIHEFERDSTELTGRVAGITD